MTWLKIRWEAGLNFCKTIFRVSLCFSSQLKNATTITALMQTEMPRKYTAPAKEPVRKLLVPIQDYKQHTHTQKQLFKPFLVNLYPFCHLLTQSTCTPMEFNRIKISGKGRQLVPQRLVRSGVLTARLQRIRVNIRIRIGPWSCQGWYDSHGVKPVRPD